MSHSVIRECAPDIVVDEEAPNKFVIGGGESGRECLTEQMFKKIDNEHGREVVSKLNEYRVKENFDTDAIECDLEDLKQSNFHQNVEHVAAVKSMQKMVVKIQSELIIFLLLLLALHAFLKFLLNISKKHRSSK